MSDSPSRVRQACRHTTAKEAAMRALKLFVGALVLLAGLSFAGRADAHVTGRCPQYEAALRRAGMPASYFSRIMWRESRCQAKAVNRRSGATGLLQIMPAHARYGRWHTCRQTHAELRTAAGNIACAARLYRIAGTRPWATTR